MSVELPIISPSSASANPAEDSSGCGSSGSPSGGCVRGGTGDAQTELERAIDAGEIVLSHHQDGGSEWAAQGHIPVAGVAGPAGKRGREVQPIDAARLPKWLKRELPRGNGGHFTDRLLDDLKLVTVCEEARCPNRMECFASKTATFMILGDTCTRPCGFCAVMRGRPKPPAPDEPARLAEAASRLGLAHVVITSVTRDDLPDGGAEHFARCIDAVRSKTGATVEVLTPDFVDNYDALDVVIAAAPEVFNHNTETVPRLYRRVRGPKSRYGWTLEMLAYIKRQNPAIKTKSGLMLGLGETTDELLDTLADLRAHEVDFLTLGQYLQPDPKRYLPVLRYVPPEEFTTLGKQARAMGFSRVASGPFVRSSYHAREMAEA